ncbi:hypothetical protein CHS0354_001849 [Potamilus streckersoni]|uniref:Uncharacterized protein n=1 Tax=Potamilus streckersoni TaxID=2493646 RepID=A0AAE0S777_9BIVA|nr:hypothetical protein CHS0354_001849 [Potamilus streckersoni]
MVQYSARFCHAGGYDDDHNDNDDTRVQSYMQLKVKAIKNTSKNPVNNSRVAPVNKFIYSTS